ncbi:redox-regulated molecular chaperone Hsp33, partial [Lacticaseibacillus paracasei]
MSDYIASALSRDEHFRIFAADATQTVREAQRR